MRCSKILKGTVALVLCTALTVGCFGIKSARFEANAESISTMKSKVSELDSQKSALQSKINKLQGDIDEQQEYLDSVNSYIATVESKIVACENLLASYQSEIDEYNKEIDKKNKELAENKELFKRRIRSIYMSGTNSSLSLLLDSDYYTNYLSMSQFTEGIAKYDNALISQINTAVNSINKKIEKKNAAAKEQESIKAQLSKDRADLQSKYDTANSTLNNINKSKSELQAEMNEIEKSKKAYESKISAAYEAARKAALAAQQSNNTASAPNVKYDGKGFAWPLPGYSTITSQFGMRYDPYYLCYRGHNGIDISGGGVAGKPIVASAAGTVTVTEPTATSGGYGNYVIISHGMVNGSLLTTHYGHMMSFAVSAGQKVNQGDVIGYVGTTGASTGYHLHFEVRLNNTPVNPFNYVSY